jgi:hypothetical protein
MIALSQTTPWSVGESMPDDRDELRPEEVQQVLRRLDKKRGYSPRYHVQEPAEAPAEPSGAAPPPAATETTQESGSS